MTNATEVQQAILDVMRRVDERLGGDCRVSIVVGGRVGSAPSLLPDLANNQSVLQVIVGDFVQEFLVTDDEWDRPGLVDDVVDYVRDARAQQEGIDGD